MSDTLFLRSFIGPHHNLQCSWKWGK